MVDNRLHQLIMQACGLNRREEAHKAVQDERYAEWLFGVKGHLTVKEMIGIWKRFKPSTSRGKQVFKQMASGKTAILLAVIDVVRAEHRLWAESTLVF